MEAMKGKSANGHPDVRGTGFTLGVLRTVMEVCGEDSPAMNAVWRHHPHLFRSEDLIRLIHEDERMLFGNE